MSNCLSRWWYTCICQWRELAFHPDWNVPDLRVVLHLILKMGREVSWTFPFHIPHSSVRCISGLVRTTFCVFFWDVLSHIGVHVLFFYAIRYSHWVLLLLPVESHSCFWWVPYWRNVIFLTWADPQCRGCHFWILLYPYLLFGTCYLVVWWLSMKGAAYLPVEHIAHFGSAGMLFCWALCYHSITLNCEVFPIGDFSFWCLS